MILTIHSTKCRRFAFGALLVASMSIPAFSQSACTSGNVGTWFPSDWTLGTGPIGYQVAVNALGDRVAVCGNVALHQGLEVGAVWVLSNPGAPTQASVKLLPSIYHDSMRFGSSLGFNAAGDVLIVGAPGSGPGATSPRVFVFRFDGASWIEEWIVGGASNDHFGHTVAVSATGDMFVVGAPLRDNGFTIDDGAVVVCRRQSGAWAQETTILPSQLPGSRGIGSSISLSADGSLLAVRSFSPTNAPMPNGAIFLLERTGTAWTQIAMLQEPVAYSLGGFGGALALDGAAQTLAAGNPQDSRLAYQHGAVSIFRKGSSSWAYDTVLLPGIPSPNAAFGTSLAVNDAGDRLLVGAPVQSVGGVIAGAVEEFELGRSGWQRGATHSARNPENSAKFGRAVRASSSGRRWVANEILADAYQTDAGQVHLFEAPCLTPVVYCTAQTNTLGCVPQISAQGTPSASSTGGFRIVARSVRNQQNGMLLYGTSGRASIPWLGGTLCVQPPLRRTPTVNSGGALPPLSDCSGALVRDFNTWAHVAADPALFPGQHVRAQFYSRDPGAPQNLNLSDAVEFYLEP